MAGRPVPITPSVLKWAIDEAGVDEEEIADHLKIDALVVSAWVQGHEKPLTGQFRKLARFLGRPETTFLRPRPPAQTGVPPAFRHPPGTPPERTLTREESQAVRSARRVQRVGRWIALQLEPDEVVVPDIPELEANKSPADAAAALTSWLDWNVTIQTNARNPWEVLKTLRSRVEARGVMALHLPMGDKGCRGFSLADDVRPLAAINTWYRPEPRIFSYGHELAHLASRTSSICVGYEATRTERWCEQVSAALFLPADALREYISKQWAVDEVSSSTQISKIATKFKLSLSATTVRLIHLGITPKHMGYLIDHGRDSHTDSSGGKGEKNSEKRIREWGAAFASLMLDAEESGLLKRHLMLEYLDLPQSQLGEWRALARDAESGSPNAVAV